MGVPGDDVIPCTSKQSLPHEEEVGKWAEVARQFFKEVQDLSQASHPCLQTAGLTLSSLATPAPKYHVKQGPIKSSKKLKLKPTDDNE